MIPTRVISGLFITTLSPGTYGQCTWSTDTTESYSTIEDPVILNEVISLIPWVWEYEGVGPVPEFLITEATQWDDEWIHFRGTDIDVFVSKEDFDSTKALVTYGHQDQHRFVCAINGRRAWGTDGDLPRQQIGSLSIKIDERTIPLPRTSWSDLFEPKLCADLDIDAWCGPRVLRSMDRERVYVHMRNSDGAGGYTVTWIFVNGRYLRRVLEGPP